MTAHPSDCQISGSTEEKASQSGRGVVLCISRTVGASVPYVHSLFLQALWMTAPLMLYQSTISPGLYSYITTISIAQLY